MPRRKGRDGRPTLLNEEKRALMLQVIRDGDTLQVAATLAGVAVATAEEWRRRGKGLDQRPATPLYRKFAEDVAMAEAWAQHDAVMAVRGHMRRDYNAAKFWLQSRRPEEWGDKVAEQLTPSGYTGPVITGGNIIVISPEQAQMYAAGILQQARLDAGISASPHALADLSVGPEDDQR